MQWVALISAVQELTAQNMQARVLSVLEAIGAAMPGIGFLLGGLHGVGLSAPASRSCWQGSGVLAIVAVAAPLPGDELARKQGKAPPRTNFDVDY